MKLNGAVKVHDLLAAEERLDGRECPGGVQGEGGKRT